jgi:hypothetical protein
MKNIMVCLLVLFVFTVSAYAETSGELGHAGHEAMKGEKQQMQMMCPKMEMMQQGKEMMKDGQQMPRMHQTMAPCMMQDMMQTMMDMLNTQEKIIAGVKASEKKQLLKNIKDMKAKMQSKLSACPCMMGGKTEPQPPVPSKESPGGEKEKTGQHAH